MDKKMKYIYLIIIFTMGVIFASYEIYSIHKEYNKSNNTYLELREFIEIPEREYIENESLEENLTMETTEIVQVSRMNLNNIQKEYSQSSTSHSEFKELIEIFESNYIQEDLKEKLTTKTTEISQFPIVDFESLKGINSDIVGWIYIDGTVIDYPIVQGQDNSYYLKHLFDKNYSSSGCIFLDCNNSFDFSDYNNVIYGHHMKNGTMFSEILEYKNQEYYDKHSQVILITPKQNYIIELFAGYVASVNDSAWQILFNSSSEFEKWLVSIKERSCFISQVYPIISDKIITFSTCSYEFDNARFVLHGILK